MSEEERHAVLDVAYDRLAKSIATTPFGGSRHTRDIALQTLDDLRHQIETDPAFVNQLFARVADTTAEDDGRRREGQ